MDETERKAQEVEEALVPTMHLRARGNQGIRNGWVWTLCDITAPVGYIADDYDAISCQKCWDLVLALDRKR